jgi:hypothetical protein
VSQFTRKVELGFRNSVAGLGFVLIAMLMLLWGNHDYWWVLPMLVGVMFLEMGIFQILGKRISQILAVRYLRHAGLLVPSKPAETGPREVPNQPRERLLDNSVSPSITEDTTRNMNQRAEERQGS